MCDVMNLEPKDVFRYFKEISDVPRSSFHNEKISAYLVGFAKEHELDYYQDDMGNVIIYKEATPGYEDAPTIMLQGHMDMVAVKTEESNHDFEKDPIELVIDGDWLTAKDTTLGADNGIAVAMGLAVLAADDIPHPALEVVVTVDEEVGMLGAAGLDGSKLRSRKVINIDSEEEGVITVGCAGGVDVDVVIPVHREDYKGIVYRYSVDGLKGGHSGAEIDQERANAVAILGRVLAEAVDYARFHLGSIEGGQAPNVIMSKVSGEIIVNEKYADKFEKCVAESAATIQMEYRTSDPNLNVTFERTEQTELNAIDGQSQIAIIRYLMALPMGVQHMSMEIDGLVETSHSVGVVEMTEQDFHTRSMIRSSVNSRKKDLINRIQIIVNLVGGAASFSGEYGAWEFDSNSPLLDVAIDVYKEQTGKEPVVSAIHAGLECGKWIEKLGNIEAISIGPDMPGVHSVDEKVSISSTERTWEFIKGILAASK